MELSGKKILVLGGWGMVGIALCRMLLDKKPKKLVRPVQKRISLAT